MDVPQVDQLRVPPEYGSPSTLLAWEAVVARLAEAKHYWLVTGRPDGRPHVVALDGLWIDGRWYFGGVPTTQWQRNLRTDPRAVLHLEDAMSAVIVEGTCRVEQPDEAFADQLAAASKEKYGYGPPASVYLGGVWALRPAVARAWTDFTVDATRYVFAPEHPERSRPT